MSYRTRLRRRRRSMTKAHLRIQKHLERAHVRREVLQHGIAQAIERLWESEDLRSILDIIVGELQPLLNDIEQMEERLSGRARKSLKPVPTVKKNTKAKDRSR